MSQKRPKGGLFYFNKYNNVYKFLNMYTSVQDRDLQFKELTFFLLIESLSSGIWFYKDTKKPLLIFLRIVILALRSRDTLWFTVCRNKYTWVFSRRPFFYKELGLQFIHLWLKSSQNSWRRRFGQRWRNLHLATFNLPKFLNLSAKQVMLL